MAKRKSAAAEAIQPLPVETATPAAETIPAAAATELPDERQTARFPDPREQKQISLGLGKDSPKLRLLRSHRFNQMQIRSDEELPAAPARR